MMFRIFFIFFISCATNCIFAQDLATYQPEWIKEGFADAGATHEPWIFQVRRNSYSFNQWQREQYDYHLSEDYIRSLAEAGVTVYHIFCYKGFGFQAEKEHMDLAAKASEIAHKYGMKVDTYIQWNTLAYETFFTEVPQAEKDKWYQIDVNGKPIMIAYGFQQSFRFRPCFNHDGYMNYFKEKILRYAVEKVKTDFIHFDNFDMNHPRDADHNPATIAAFRKYIEDKYTQSQRLERFGFKDISHVLPPMWNDSNPAEQITTINDPVIQEWIDFRCWTLTTRLAECSRFVRQLNKEIVIEVNPHGLVGSNRAWEAAINHPDLMKYTNVIWTEDNNNPRWENGVAVGKFRHYKLGRITHNFILTYNRTPQDFAENLSLNRTIAWLGVGIPKGVGKVYLDFWKEHKDLYVNAEGAEKVAVLRSYPSMAYNNRDTQLAVNMAEQALQQCQIPFDIIFDQQIDLLHKYDVVVLAEQESLTDHNLNKVKQFVKNGGGLVAIGNTALYDGWRRVRKIPGLQDLFGKLELSANVSDKETIYNEKKEGKAVQYGKGRAVYIPILKKADGPVKLGYNTRWEMPTNASEFETAVFWASADRLPLKVVAPDWVGVSHDKQSNRDIVHFFNYRNDQVVLNIVLEYRGQINKAWSVSPHRQGRKDYEIAKKGDLTIIQVPRLEVYEVFVLER
jgi:hypothetical protein